MMFKRNKTMLFIVILLIAASVFMGTKTTAESKKYPEENRQATIRIHQGEDIQEKIDEARDGATLVIASGEYSISKPLVITGRKSITLVGDKDVWIMGDRVDFQIFRITDSQNISLKGIKACHKIDLETGNKKIEEKRMGSVIDIENSKNITLENCELEGCGVYGVYAVDTDKINILGCYLHHNSWRALGLYNRLGVTNVLIKNCTIMNNADFIEKEGNIAIQFEGNNVIRNNTYEDYENNRR